MAVKSTGLDAKFALPGLTVILALLAFWIGTRRPGALGGFPSGNIGAYGMALVVMFCAFWIGSRNPHLFGSLPIIGAAADGNG